MSRSSSCIRCGNALAEDTPGGLCATCVNSPVPASLDAVTNFDGKTESVLVEAQATNTFGPETVRVKAPPVLPPGYEFRGPLGQGGMGVVVRAFEVAGDREVALKVIRASTDEAARKRFRVEAQSLARLKHPNVVQVFSVGVNATDPYFTMELVDGPGLDKVLRVGPLPVAEAVRLIAGAARGIAAAHAAGVVHRDVKPSNILLARDGTPKVTDFGLAKRTDRDDQLTIPEAMLGTPSYMAPEQAGRKHEDIGPLSDVYSLGATLYALLAGQPPFHADDPVLTAALVLTAPPRPLRELRPDVPEPLERIVEAAMAKEPKDRFPTPGELADALERWSDGLPVQTGRPDPARGPRSWPRRKKALASFAVLVGGGLLATVLARPLGPVPEARNDLANGKAVVLVPEKGEPARHEWKLGKTALGPSPTQDGACYFETLGEAVLELSRDPGVDRYRLSAELQMLRCMVVKNANGAPLADEEHLAVYFGFTEPDGPPGANDQRFYSVGYRDVLAGNPRLAAASQVRFSDVRVNRHVGQIPTRTTAHLAQRPLDLIPVNTGFPGPWRRIQIDVSPERVAVGWQPTLGAKLEHMADWRRVREADPPPARFEDLLLGPPALPPTVRTTYPGWHPRLPLGIWAFRSGVAFRNVTLTPLP